MFRFFWTCDEIQLKVTVMLNCPTYLFPTAWTVCHQTSILIRHLKKPFLSSCLVWGLVGLVDLCRSIRSLEDHHLDRRHQDVQGADQSNREGEVVFHHLCDLPGVVQAVDLHLDVWHARHVFCLQIVQSVQASEEADAAWAAQA